MADYVPGAGDVSVELEGEKLWLRPSLGACLTLSGHSSALRGLADRCLMLDINAVAFVIAAGLDKKPDEILESVFKTGIVNLLGSCLRFIRVVSNGGRPPEDENKPEDPPASS